MASLYQWITESTPASTTLPPAVTPTAAQTLTAVQFPPWNSAPIPYQPQPPATGSLKTPYIYPVPPTATPLPPAGIAAVARGPQTPPMGPFGPGAGGFGVAPNPPIPTP